MLFEQVTAQKHLQLRYGINAAQAQTKFEETSKHYANFKNDLALNKLNLDRLKAQVQQLDIDKANAQAEIAKAVAVIAKYETNIADYQAKLKLLEQDKSVDIA